MSLCPLSYQIITGFADVTIIVHTLDLIPIGYQIHLKIESGSTPSYFTMLVMFNMHWKKPIHMHIQLECKDGNKTTCWRSINILAFYWLTWFIAFMNQYGVYILTSPCLWASNFLDLLLLVPFFTKTLQILPKLEHVH